MYRLLVPLVLVILISCPKPPAAFSSGIVAFGAGATDQWSQTQQECLSYWPVMQGLLRLSNTSGDDVRLHLPYVQMSMSFSQRFRTPCKSIVENAVKATGFEPAT